MCCKCMCMNPIALQRLRTKVLLKHSWSLFRCMRTSTMPFVEALCSPLHSLQHLLDFIHFLSLFTDTTVRLDLSVIWAIRVHVKPNEWVNSPAELAWIDHTFPHWNTQFADTPIVNVFLSCQEAFSNQRCLQKINSWNFQLGKSNWFLSNSRQNWRPFLHGHPHVLYVGCLGFAGEERRATLFLNWDPFDCTQIRLRW